MRKIEIALGCDGLLGNFAEAVLVIVEEVTGKRFSLADVTEHDITKALGLTAREACAVREAISDRRGFVLSLRPYPQARQWVRRLRELGEVFCMSTPWEPNPSWWLSERESWLALHFGIDRVHHAGDGNARCAADVFADENSSHVREWLIEWPGRTAVFWRSSHNAGETVPCGAHSIGSWEGLYQVVREVARSAVQRPLPRVEVAP